MEESDPESKRRSQILPTNPCRTLENFGIHCEKVQKTWKSSKNKNIAYKLTKKNAKKSSLRMQGEEKIKKVIKRENKKLECNCEKNTKEDLTNETAKVQIQSTKENIFRRNIDIYFSQFKINLS